MAFLVFTIVGAGAFVIDAAVLMLAIAAGLGPLSARVPSFLAAVTSTWLLNRRFTFRITAAPSLREYAAYLASQLSGAAANLGVYSALVLWIPLAARWPVLAVAAGSLSGLVVNFLAARLALATRMGPEAERGVRDADICR